MMKLKKKGFTLTELIGVITILGIIVLLAFPPLLGQFKETKISIDKATEQFIIAGATNYVEENKNYFPKTKDELYCVSLRTLVDDNKISNNLKDTEGNNLNLNEMVSVNVNNGKYDINFDGTCSIENIAITLNTSNLTLSVNETYKLEAKVSLIGVVSDNLKWTSSDPTVVTVSNNGLVTALKVGTATITVSTTDELNITKTITVNVKDTRKPEYASYEVKNITNKGYDVYVYGVSDESGIDKVKFPTWTAYNDKDDLEENWESSLTSSGKLEEDGTYYFRVNTLEHNGESGIYYTEIHLYDSSGNKTIINAIETTVPSILVTINVNDSTAGKVSNSSINVGYGARYELADNVIKFPAGQSSTATITEKMGYTITFKGWVIPAETIIEETTITADFNKVANTYEIVYDANGGTGAPSSQSYTYAESGTITLSDAKPMRTGYTFQGWGTSKTDTTVDYNPGSTFNKNVAQNTTLYAIWKINSYVVNYDANGGTGAPQPTTYTYDANENTTLSAIKPTRTGYTFIGWSQDKSATTKEYDAGDIWWRGNIGEFILYAIWTPSSNTKYTVNHYQMNTSGAYPTAATETESKTGTTDSAIILSNLVKTYTGFSYSYGSVGGSTVTTTTIAPDGSRVINLYYTRTKYTVTLTKGTGISALSGAGEYYHGASVTIDATVSAGYEWKNWTGTHSTTTKTYTFTMPLSNVNDTANANIVTYTISYTLNGGVATNPTSYNVNTETFTLVNPTRTGYTFTGWTGSNGTTASTSVSIAKGSTGNKTYTAKWQAKTITVTFNKNDGSGSTASQTFTYGQSGNRFGYNTDGSEKWGNTGQFGQWNRTGYTLLGWSHDPNATSATYSIYSGVSDDWINGYYPSTTLYAIWQVNTYTVSLARGTGISSISGAGTYNYGATVTIDATVANGYTWSKWSGTHSTTTKKYSFIMPASNVLDTANATPNTYTITYHANGGSGAPGQQSYTYNPDANITLSGTIPTRSNYTFLGWSQSSSATSASYSAGQTWWRGNTANYNLYAVWADRTGPSFTSFTGELLYTDPEFASGWNGISTYGAAESTVTRKAMSGLPNSSGYGLQITATDTASGANYGGISFGTTCPAYSQNIYVARIVAKIPSGYYLQFASNAWPAVADNGWLTNNWNSGDWEEYIFYFSCGAYGAQFTTNYFYLSGGTTPTASNPVTWYVASATVINLSGNDNYIISYATDALSKVTHHQHTTSSATPSSWNQVKTNKTAGSGYKVSPGTHYIWFKDSAGNPNSWKITVPN